jgi:hypothetical protein
MADDFTQVSDSGEGSFSAEEYPPKKLVTASRGYEVLADLAGGTVHLIVSQTWSGTLTPCSHQLRNP